MIEAFKKELTRKVLERDPRASVNIFSTLETPMTGEYMCIIESGRGETEMYAFHPRKKSWVLVYNV